MSTTKVPATPAEELSVLLPQNRGGISYKE